MDKLLILVRQYLDDEEADIVKHRQEGDEIVFLVNKGIAGVKKYRVPLSELTEKQPELPPVDEAFLPVESPDDGLPVPAAFDLNSLDDMDYRQLQALAKERDIPANITREGLISALELAHIFEEEEE